MRRADARAYTAPMNPVTIRQCAVLVGGLGTRLGALTADTPKPILPCGDRPFLAWLLRECIRFGVEDFLLLTGHLSDRVAEAARGDPARHCPADARITISREPIRAGTGGALVHARAQLDDRFLLLNGDTLFDFNLSNLLADAADDGPDVVGRMVLRQLDDVSRFGVVHARRRPRDGVSRTPRRRALPAARSMPASMCSAARCWIDLAAGLLAGARRAAAPGRRRRAARHGRAGLFPRHRRARRFRRRPDTKSRACCTAARCSSIATA